MCTGCYAEGGELAIPDVCPGCGQAIEDTGVYVATPLEGETMRQTWERFLARFPRPPEAGG